MLVGIFEKPGPKTYQDSLLWALLGGINSKTTHCQLTLTFFQLKSLKGTAKAPAVNRSNLNTKTTCLIPERYGRIYSCFSKVQKL